MKTFLFFAHHLILVEKWELCRREDLFFALHLILVKKLHECSVGAI